MDLVLHSERLELAPLSLDDLDLVAELRGNPEVMRYIADPISRSETADRMPKLCRRSADGSMGIWSVAARQTGEPVGTAILLPLPEDEADTRWDFHENGKAVNEDVEVGYMLKPSAWGRGFATEITRRLLRFAFEQTALERVVAVTHEANAASQNVLLKAGLEDTGPRRAYTLDLPGFTITKSRLHTLCAAQS